MIHRDPIPLRSSDDPLKTQLKQAIRRDPRRRARLVITLILLAIVASLGAWWLWPRAMVPPLVVIAFDEVGLADRPLTLHAATEPLDGSDVRWGDRDLFFEEVKGLAPGTSGTTKKVASDSNGLATVAWQFPRTPSSVEMEVRYLDDRQRPPWSERDTSRVFLWSPDARVLVVDVEPTLAQAKDIDALAQALAAATEKGWNVVYLATSAERPLDYRKLRSAAQKRAGAAAPGPVLGRKTYYQSATAADARKEVLADLKRVFSGPLLLATAEDGLKLWTVAGNGTTMNPVPIDGWSQLDAALPQ